MISGRSGGHSGGYTGRTPELDPKEKHYKKMEEFREKELKMKEDHYRRMEDRQMVFAYYQAKEKREKNNKPNPKAKLKESYKLWAEANLTPNTKKSLFRDDVERDWIDSDDYEKWYDWLE